MKKVVLVAGLLACNLIFSQDNHPYFIKNYKAPDFKLRYLMANFGSNGSGNFVSDNFDSRLDGSLHYYHISNSKKYQGEVGSTYILRFGHSSDTNHHTIGLSNQIANNIQNRFYFKELWFVGVHDYSSIRLANSGETNQNGSASFRLFMQPQVSIGYGRLEYVQFARRAMDIEYLFKKNKIYNESFSENQLKTIADKIALISNKRYLDRRIGLMDQLELLDNTLQDLGIGSEKNIRYFAQLMDSYVFANHMHRRSGFRAELGVSESLGIFYNTASPLDLGLNYTHGFLDLQYHLPTNYALQHTFRFSTLGGIRQDLINNNNEPGLWAIANYTLGWYPNTRTELYTNATLGSSFEDNDAGYYSQLSLDFYYYFSPRFRLNATASYYLGSTYTQPTIFNLVPSTSNVNGGLHGYRFNLGFSYAIF
ncbi:hypothetical protein K6119_10215 [Paracrocinitomix mangrovi]|uniref:hypothetical protein n=1 Tax=Paracrocinitomix mangrovi TaxID=2862509 RepID=UPI001C8F092F|nr:hypothetical protein [Paracrocinitomix mangrovi]UKN00107.1 hypothetical protein K6119_10215 [Paracrocinitomix mangrovi]